MRCFITICFTALSLSLFSQGLSGQGIVQFSSANKASSAFVAPIRRLVETPKIDVDTISHCFEDNNFSIRISNITPKAKYKWYLDSSLSTSTIYGDSILVTSIDTGTFAVKVRLKYGFRKRSSMTLVTTHPNPHVVADTIEVCQAQTTIIESNIENCQTCSYKWSNGDTNRYTNINLSSDSQISLVVENSFGCRDSQIIYLTATALPLLSLSNDTTYICRGTDGVIQANSSQTDVNYVWSTGDTTQSILVSPNADTSYVVYVQNQTSCRSDSLIAHVVVFDNPTINMPDKIWLCLNDSIDVMPIVNGGKPPYNFSWTGGTSSPSITIHSGVYVLDLTVLDANGCAAVDSVLVFVNDFDVANSFPTIICLGDSIDISTETALGTQGHLSDYLYGSDTVRSGSADLTQWSFAPIKSDTLYTYTVSDSGCYRVLKDYIHVNTLPENNTVGLLPRYSNVDTVFFISDSTNPNFIYEWRINNDFYSSKSDTIWLPYDTGTYSIDLLTSDQNSCKWEDTETIKVEQFTDSDILGHILYPNPNNGQFQFNFNSKVGHSYQINILDMSGRSITERSIDATKSRTVVNFLMSDAASGSYILTLETESGVIINTQRLIIVN
jgi:hypothetical protein